MFGWAAIVAASVLSAGAAARTSSGPLYSELHAAPPVPGAAATLPDLSRLASSATPAVVGVVTYEAPPATADDQLKSLLDKLHDGPRKGIGSGFVIQADGWVLTNAHVVEGAERVEVDFGGGRPKLPARVVGADAESDIALLKIQPARPLPSLPLGDSDHIQIAEWVMVIGSPFGLDHTVTVGVISHTGRTDISPVGRPGFYDFIQTDASINPGNSGGPLLNLRGEVVGIATAVNATGQGIGFAIPINMAKEIVGQLHDHGKVVRSWLGVAVRESPDGSSGVLVTEVAAGGPAAAAGVRPGDVIVAFEGRLVRSPGRLRWSVATAGVGRDVEVRVRRGPAEERSVHVALTEAPRGEAVASPAAAPVGRVGRGSGE